MNKKEENNEKNYLDEMEFSGQWFDKEVVAS